MNHIFVRLFLFNDFNVEICKFSFSNRNVSLLRAWVVLVPSGWSNGALSPVVQGDITLSTNIREKKHGTKALELRKNNDR